MNAMADTACVDLVLFGIGILSLAQGILMQLGILKYWFATKRVPTLVIPDIAFGLIPIGLAFLVLGITPQFVANPIVDERIFLYLVCPLWGIGLVFTLWPPRWLKPHWYRWLEDHHGGLMPQLRKDAQRIGRWRWQRMVRTQEGLEQWAEEVRQRHQSGT